MANIFFFLCGLVLLWRVDRMPIEIGNLSAHWKGTWEKLQELWTRRRHRSHQRAALQDSSPHRKRFSARFPLILDDMILRDFALYLGMVLATFLILALVFTFFELLTDIVRNKVPVIMLAEYLLNLSPSLLYLMAPIAVLLAVLITFGLLEKSSELTAMKATGISIYRAALPVIVVCAIFAAAMFVFDQLYIPHTNREQEILRNQIKGKPPQTYLQADRKWIFGQNNDIYYYQVFDPDTNQLGGVSIFEFDPEYLPAHAPHLCRARALGRESEQVGLRAGLDTDSVGHFHPGLSHLRCGHLQRTARGPELLQERSQAVLGDELSKSCSATSATWSRAASTPCA